jgi:hypothetical protein
MNYNNIFKNSFSEYQNVFNNLLNLKKNYSEIILDYNNDILNNTYNEKIVISKFKNFYKLLNNFFDIYQNFYNSKKINFNYQLSNDNINKFNDSLFIINSIKQNNNFFKKEFLLEYLLKYFINLDNKKVENSNIYILNYILLSNIKKIINNTSFIFMIINNLSNNKENDLLFNLLFNDILNLKIKYRKQNILIYAIKKNIKEDYLCKLFDKIIEIGFNIDEEINENRDNILHFAYSFGFLKLAEKIEEKFKNLKDKKNNSGFLPCTYYKFELDKCKDYKNKDNIKILNINNLDGLITKDFPNIKINNFLISPTLLNLKIKGDKLGEGGFGSTYTIIIDDKEYVYKSQLLCSSSKIHLKNICDDFKKSISNGYFNYTITQNNFNNIISFPTFVSENIIGSFLNNLIDNNICHNFVKSYSMYILKPTLKAEIISVMEKLDGNIIDIFINFLLRKLNSEDYLNIQLQILYALYILRYNNIQHNDLHLQNILYKQIKSPFLTKQQNDSIKNDYFINGISTQYIPFFEFYIDGIPIKIKNLGYLIKIIDYGFSYINKSINGKFYKIMPNYKLPPNIYTGYIKHEFNFDIDLYTWIVNFLTTINRNKYSESRVERSIDFNLNENLIKYDLFENYNFIKNLNLKIINNLGINLDKLNHPTLPHRISKDILNFKFNNFGEIAKILNDEYKIMFDYEISSYSDNDKVIAKNFLKWNKNNYISNFITNYFINSDFKEYLSLKTDLFNNENFNFNSISKFDIGKNTKISNFSFKMNNNSIQFINIASFNIHTDNINFFQSCCGLTGPQYLENNKFNNNNFTYATINSSFFDIKKSLKPVLIYKDKFNIYNNKNDFLNKLFGVNDKYLNLYKVLLWNNHKDYKLISYKNEFLDNYENYYNNYNYILSVAPLLYDFQNPNTNEVNDLKNYWLDKDNIDIFNCNNNIDNDTNRELSCKTINPGELSHAEQPNPRSILIFDENYIHFMVIEGRGSRGDGMKFSEIRSFCHKFFNKLKYVINLDGGASSHLTVKPFNHNHSFVLNPTYINTIKDKSPSELYYPVGSILIVEDKN